MATESSGSSNGFLYFMVGILLVGMIVLGLMYFNGGLPGAAPASPVERAADAVGDAADKVGDAAKDATNGG
jgi:hypothetical protein